MTPSELSRRSSYLEAEKEQAEEDLLQSARLKLRAEITILVAHDLGNQLTVIQNAAQMLHDHPELPDRNLLDLILSSSRWALSLSRQLQGLAHDDGDVARPADCNELIREQSGTLAGVLGSAVTLDFELSPMPIHAAIDHASLREVLLNLALNSRDAMTDGGVFHVSVGLSSPPEKSSMPPEPCVHITVRDTGHGMDEETRLHAFEPHFSRKEKNGSPRRGLGLVSVERTISRAKGMVLVESAPGKGARFDLYLPLARECQAAG